MRALLVIFLMSAAPGLAQHVLSARLPVAAQGLVEPARLTDGVVAHDGAVWDDPVASTFGPGAFVQWDLGEVRTLTGAALQADNNDLYIVSVSDDGVAWREVWRAGAERAVGLRTRSTDALSARGRYVKLTAEGGDWHFSVSELELFSPGASDSVLLRWAWLPRVPLERQGLWLLAVAALLLTLASARMPKLLTLALAGVGLWCVYDFVFVTTPSTPGAQASLPWLRAGTAVLAMLALLRDRLWRGRWPAHRGFISGTLAVSAALGLWCFLNLGTPQFWDQGARSPQWLHHYDMRTYFPIAKYFPELRFDGVYAASVLVLAEGREPGAFDGQPLRDLRTHDMTHVREAKDHLEEVRRRFTPERWSAFVADMGYFRSAMGDRGYLHSMRDHGGNATPVWFLAARALFVEAPASDATLWRGVLADIGLFALAILSLWWAFGLRAALMSVTVFGAMGFYQFGSNWFGATLRHDWLSLWAIGLALLKKRRFELAGAALAWSACIRAFPALTLVTLAFPSLYGFGRAWLSGRREVAVRELRPLLRVALGVAVAVVVLVGLSSMVFGFDAWLEWLRKVQILDRDNHSNNIAFRTYISDAKAAWWAAVVVAFSALFYLLRRAEPWRAAVWGVALVPIVFNPANYYLHAYFLFVTLAVAQTVRGLLVWVALLLMCVASAVTTLLPDVPSHFRAETVVAFVTLGVLLVLEPRHASAR